MAHGVSSACRGGSRTSEGVGFVWRMEVEIPIGGHSNFKATINSVGHVSQKLVIFCKQELSSS